MNGYPSEVQNLQFPFNCFEVRLKGYDNQAQEASNLFSYLTKNNRFAQNTGFIIIDIFITKSVVQQSMHASIFITPMKSLFFFVKERALYKKELFDFQQRNNVDRSTVAQMAAR